MIKSFSFQLTAVLLTVLFAYGVLFVPLSVSAHGDEVHDTEEGVNEKMLAIITLLEYIQEIYEVQIKNMGLVPVSKVMSDAHTEHDSTHAHVPTDLSGIHIMADGNVMLGNGELVADATINEDDVIVLSDGTMVKPVMDMRVTHDNEEMEHSDEAASIHFEIHDGMTHVHYTNAHGELMTFFIDHDLSEESEIISAIMEETGLDQVTVEKLVDFTDVIEWDE